MTTRDSGGSRTNFAHLEVHDEQLVRLGMLAERYFAEDPNTALLKLRQLAELLAQLAATKVGIYTSREEAQYELLRRLQDQGILPREIAQLFGEVRRAGNAANHAIIGDHRMALFRSQPKNVIARDRLKQAAKRARELIREDQEFSAVARACVESAGDPRVTGLLRSA